MKMSLTVHLRLKIKGTLVAIEKQQTENLNGFKKRLII